MAAGISRRSRLLHRCRLCLALRRLPRPPLGLPSCLQRLRLRRLRARWRRLSVRRISEQGVRGSSGAGCVRLPLPARRPMLPFVTSCDRLAIILKHTTPEGCTVRDSLGLVNGERGRSGGGGPTGRRSPAVPPPPERFAAQQRAAASRPHPPARPAAAAGAAATPAARWSRGESLGVPRRVRRATQARRRPPSRLSQA